MSLIYYINYLIVKASQVTLLFVQVVLLDGSVVQPAQTITTMEHKFWRSATPSPICGNVTTVTFMFHPLLTFMANHGYLRSLYTMGFLCVSIRMFPTWAILQSFTKTQKWETLKWPAHFSTFGTANKKAQIIPSHPLTFLLKI